MHRSRPERRRGVQQTSSEDTPEDYLKKSGILRHIQQALNDVLQLKPDDPVAFLVEYFGDKVELQSAVERARKELVSVHHSDALFQDHIYNAYLIMTTKKSSEDAVGLTGSLFTDLLHLLLKPVPPVYAERLASRLQCRSHELVSYAIFSTGVKACLILRDFLRKAKSLFNLLDVSNCALVNKTLCESALLQLQGKQADNLERALQEAVGLSGPSMTLEEFLKQAVATYISQVIEEDIVDKQVINFNEGTRNIMTRPFWKLSIESFNIL
ncbi:tubulin polyglutamylase complex subunit 1-like isoform X2 [Oscarella lobularis]|uniref:tubulin polyglutamylase complex subunit 1-like isoform X2 n=1 Tax=Oscarella lobularis TaxID=121494 RepID=UPI003313F93E